MMNRLFTKHLALAMLVILMANTGMWSIHSNWLVHELEHDAAPVSMASDHAVIHGIDTGGKGDADPSSAVSHQLLHAAEPIQFFLGSHFSGIFLPLTRIVRPAFLRVAVPAATFEAPFRPPRFTSSFI